MIHRTFDTEFDCPWMTVCATIKYSFDETTGMVDDYFIRVRGQPVTDWFNSSYIYDLIADDMEERA
jgi:hypothetical protein